MQNAWSAPELTGHLVTAHGELARDGPAHVGELEQVTSHSPCDGAVAGHPAREPSGAAELARHLAALLLQSEPEIFAIPSCCDRRAHLAVPRAADVLGHQRSVDPVGLGAAEADGEYDRHEETGRVLHVSLTVGARHRCRLGVREEPPAYCGRPRLAPSSRLRSPSAPP